MGESFDIEQAVFSGYLWFLRVVVIHKGSFPSLFVFRP